MGLLAGDDDDEVIELKFCEKLPTEVGPSGGRGLNIDELVVMSFERSQ